MTVFIQIILSGIMVGAIYGLVAVGFVLIVKSSKIFNFAQGELLVFGAYVCWGLLCQLHLPIWTTIVLTMLISYGLGALLTLFPLRPMLGQPLFAIVVVTLSIGLIIRGGLTAIWGATSWRVFRPELIKPGLLEIGGIILSYQYIWGFGLAILTVILLSIFFKYTRIGLSMRIVAEDHQVAQAMGLKVNRVIMNTWGISAIIAAIGGILLGSINGINIPLANIGMKAIPAALIGGIESIPGAIVGGLLIGVMEAFFGGFIGHGSQNVIAYIVMIIVIIFWPYGFFGLKRIERV